MKNLSKDVDRGASKDVDCGASKNISIDTEPEQIYCNMFMFMWVIHLRLNRAFLMKGIVIEIQITTILDLRIAQYLIFTDTHILKNHEVW